MSNSPDFDEISEALRSADKRKILQGQNQPNVPRSSSSNSSYSSYSASQTISNLKGLMENLDSSILGQPRSSSRTPSNHSSNQNSPNNFSNSTINNNNTQMNEPSFLSPPMGLNSFNLSKISFNNDMAFDDVSFNDLTLADIHAKAREIGITPAQDEIDHTVIKYNCDYVLRGAAGRYLTSVRDKDPLNKAYLLGVDGQGIGNISDVIQFCPIETKEAKYIRYGSVVFLKSFYSKERYLGIKDGSKLGFFKHIPGQSEKWVLSKASESYISTLSSSNTLVPNNEGIVDMKSKGKYVRLGDVVILQAYKSDLMLVIYEYNINNNTLKNNGNNFGQPKVVRVDQSVSLHHACGWQIEAYGSLPQPPWASHRPYLSGKFITIPPAIRTSASEIENPLFPSSSIRPLSQTTIPLSELSVSDQQYLLIRDALVIFMGGEGRYIRLAAPEDKNRHDTALPSMTIENINEAKFSIDFDTADRGSASLISQLFPLFEALLRIRFFINRQSRYEFGLVSRALCSAINQVLYEFEELVIQLESLLEAGKLTLQKLSFLIMPSKQTLTLIDSLCTHCREKIGGELLNGILDIASSFGAEINGLNLFRTLFNESVKPFTRMLKLWIYLGRLEDNVGEFMVKLDDKLDKSALGNDFNSQYWDNRYTLNTNHIPRVMTEKLARRVLTAGKYLTVIRECLGHDSLSVSQEQDSSLISSTFYSNNFLQDIENNKKKEENPLNYLSIPENIVINLSIWKDDGPDLTSTIESAYLFSSKALLTLLTKVNSSASSEEKERKPSREEQKIENISLTLAESSRKGILVEQVSRAVKFFLLLEQGDFFSKFLDLAEGELKKEVKDISLPRLQQALNQAIQISSIGNHLPPQFHHNQSQPFIDSSNTSLTSNTKGGVLRCMLATHTLIQHLALIQKAGDDGQNKTYASLAVSSSGLKGVEAFMFDYTVDWPASLVLSGRSIAKYQLLARLLHLCKLTEKNLLASWTSHMSLRSAFGRDGSAGSSIHLSLNLSNRMLHFIQALLYYFLLEVLQPRAEKMLNDIVNAEDIDQVLEAHENFLDTSMSDCLLSTQHLLKSLHKIIATCMLYSEHINNVIKNCHIQAEHTLPNQIKDLRQAAFNARQHSNYYEQQNAFLISSEVSDEISPYVIKKIENAATITSAKSKSLNAALQKESQNESFIRIINKLNSNFNLQLKEFLQSLWQSSPRKQTQLLSLASRLDYNGYYSSLFSTQNQSGSTQSSMNPN